MVNLTRILTNLHLVRMAMKKNLPAAILIGLVFVFLISGSVVAYRYNAGTYNNSQSRSAASQADSPKTYSDASIPTNPTEGAKTTTSPSQEQGAAPDQTTPPADPAKQPVKVKGLYLTGWTVASPANIKHYTDLAQTTEINSYVIDVKDDDGFVGYESSIPAVREIKAWMPKYDVDKVIKAFHENNVHLIGRIVCFKDPVLSSKKPELAVHKADGELWKERNTDGKMITWLNPYKKESWSYLVDIAKEAVEKGFDEIQFDYVRFPNDGNKKAMYFGEPAQKKYEAIDEFLAYARKELPGVTLSADVFGIICESPADTEDIGQNLEYVGRELDYLSPMAYPSHYALGQIVNGIKFSKPDLEPYGVVYNTLVKARSRISKVDGYKAVLRPYIQDFTASWLGKGNYQPYGAEQVKQEMKAVYDAGCEQWILWDANNKYSESALAKESN